MDITHHKFSHAKQHHKGFQSLDKLLKEEQWAWMSSQMINKSNFIQNVKFPTVELHLSIDKIQINPKLYYIIALDLIKGLKIKTTKKHKR